MFASHCKCPWSVIGTSAWHVFKEHAQVDKPRRVMAVTVLVNMTKVLLVIQNKSVTRDVSKIAFLELS